MDFNKIGKELGFQLDSKNKIDWNKDYNHYLLCQLIYADLCKKFNLKIFENFKYCVKEVINTTTYYSKLFKKKIPPPIKENFSKWEKFIAENN